MLLEFFSQLKLMIKFMSVFLLKKYKKPHNFAAVLVIFFHHEKMPYQKEIKFYHLIFYGYVSKEY